MEISGPIHPQGNSNACVRISREITFLIPVGRLKSTEALLLTAGDKIVMIPTQKAASRDGDSHVRMNLQITALVPICGHRGAFTMFSPPSELVVLAARLEVPASNCGRHVTV